MFGASKILLDDSMKANIIFMFLLFIFLVDLAILYGTRGIFTLGRNKSSRK